MEVTLEVTVYVDIIFAANCVVSGTLAVWMAMTLSKKNECKADTVCRAVRWSWNDHFIPCGTIRCT